MIVMEITIQTQEVSMLQFGKRKDQRDHWSNGREKRHLTMIKQEI